MIRSMTGYGHGEIENEMCKITVEIKSVNHRYLDTNIRMPRQFNPCDAAVRNQIKKYASRGKVDVYVNYEEHTTGKSHLIYNEEIAGEYVEYFNRMNEVFNLQETPHLSTLARMPGVLSLEEKTEDQEELLSMVLSAVDAACDKFVESRRVEGEHLRDDLVEKLDNVLEIVSDIEVRSPEIMKEYRERLESKLQDVMADTSIDPGRIAAEMVIYADKVCTDEEIVRLKSHVKTMRDTLVSGNKEGIGRKLDFIAQEMNRESNTILSKANDYAISECGIGLKTEIEKIREQIQNIE